MQKRRFLNFYLENYLSNKKNSNQKKMHLDAKSNHIFFISNFYAFRLLIDYRESTVQFKRRVPSFDPGIELKYFCLFLYKKYSSRHVVATGHQVHNFFKGQLPHQIR